MSTPPAPQPDRTPAHPAPGRPPHAPAAEGAGHGAPPVPERTGTIAWALGFLAYLPIPFLGLIVAGVTQLIVGLRQRQHGGLAAVNGVRAANWGLTQLCWPVLMVLTIVLGLLTGTPAPSGGVFFSPAMEVLAVTMIGLFFLVSVMEAVYAIVGTVMASKGRRVKLPVIPFLRTPRD
ncbi:hypothetical protein [Brachybacterium sp.]|uniref:hypothetical protein n=1 Tax=Brachybacterium sp. TaxID=1891286 RepID=UPI002ED54892